MIGQRSEGDVLALVGDQAGFADFAQFVQEEESCVDASQPRRHGAFEVYRKPASSKFTSNHLLLIILLLTGIRLEKL